MKEKLVSGLLYLISLLPFWLLYLISDVLFVLIFHVIGYRKRVVFENLRNAFPEKSDADIKQIALEFYRYFPDLLVEIVKLASISEKAVRERIELLNPEEVYRHIRAGKSVIGVTAHYGNWEMGIHSLSLMMDTPELIIYKPLNNKVFNEVYNRIRTRFGATMVPMKQILRHMIKLKNVPHISMFVADQTPVYQESDYFMEFLNQETLVYTGTERIARMTKSPVVFCEIRRKKKRGYYYCKFTTLVEDPDEYPEHEITHIHNRFTEQIIREEPAYWLWSHRRWKRKRRS
ncbi:lysophospholipid acyltransferase family protein [Sphingobacterium hotanense]|uniref:Lysophospholipid acyltransferase family protein n=1 Tax=Sphingobacterium hotanense TaxID=649196 RepID=A0ABT7NT43_9SPHI|nr:lysophospholipid acyltransferase family protein [Sphingobacterium hotanense]MDM1050311.1 lysophospholipid acyltransferase family protein [Sphingobacterium hotanense]